MSDESQMEQGKMQVLDYGGKILSVYRRCTCGGDVEIKKEEDGKNFAKCKRCGATLEWMDGDKLDDVKGNYQIK